MDRFRIRSLEKLLNEPGIELVYKNDAIREVILKLAILINGSQKRKKFSYAASMLEKKQYWENILMRDEDD
jgi:hypothetical protein